MNQHWYKNGEEFTGIPPDRSSVGIYESFRTYGSGGNRALFKIDEHLSRLQSSADATSMTLPVEIATIREWVKAAVAHVKIKGDLSLLLMVTGGDIFCRVMGLKVDSEIYTKGVRLITHLGSRENPRVKSLGVNTSARANERAIQAGYYDALLFQNHTHGRAPANGPLAKKYKKPYITEGARCNFFIIRGNEIMTPRSGVLEGVTRAVVMELVQKNPNLSLSKRYIALEEIAECDEIFITQTSRGIVPVRQVCHLGEEINKPVGKYTTLLISAYNEYTNKISLAI